MLFVEIGTQKRKIGRIELVNVANKSGGVCRYNGMFTNVDKVNIKFTVDHKRDEGALKLLEKTFRKAKKLVDEFYSYPKDKVREHGLIKSSDIPDRYHKAFSGWLGVATVSVLDGETAINLSDLEGFLENRRNGFVPMWD